MGVHIGVHLFTGMTMLQRFCTTSVGGLRVPGDCCEALGFMLHWQASRYYKIQAQAATAICRLATALSYHCLYLFWKTLNSLNHYTCAQTLDLKQNAALRKRSC